MLKSKDIQINTLSANYAAYMRCLATDTISGSNVPVSKIVTRRRKKFWTLMYRISMPIIQ